MADNTAGHNPANTQFRVGSEDVKGVAPRQSDMTVDHTITGETMSNERTPIELASIVKGAMKAPSLPGSLLSNGTVSVEMEAEGHIPFAMNFQRCYDTTEPFPGVFRHHLGPLRSTALPGAGTLAWEADRDDGLLQLFVGSETQAMSFTAAENAVLLAEYAMVSRHGDYWDNPEPVGINPHTGNMAMRGLERSPYWKGLKAPNGDLRILLSDYADEAAPKFKVMLGPVILTGTVSIGLGSDQVVGVGTLFLSEAHVGETLDIAGEIHDVLSIESDLALTLDAVHAGAAADVAIKLYGATESAIDPGLDSKGRANWSELRFSHDGTRVGDRAKSRPVEAYMDDAGLVGGSFAATTPATVALTGVVTIAGAAVSGLGTLFLSELEVGSALLVTGEFHRVTAITDDFNLIIHRTHTGAASQPATTLVEWTAARERPQWVQALPAGGVFSSVHTNVLFDDEVICVQTVTAGGERPVEPETCLGSALPGDLDTSGQRGITGSFERRYRDTDVRKTIEALDEFSVVVKASSAIAIAPPDETEYAVWIVLPKCIATGSRTAVVEGTDTIVETVEFTCHPDPLQAEGYTEDMVMIFWNSIADLAAI